jgi:hypothetical protein
VPKALGDRIAVRVRSPQGRCPCHGLEASATRTPPQAPRRLLRVELLGGTLTRTLPTWI